MQNVQFPMREFLHLPEHLLDEIAATKLAMVGLSRKDANKLPSELSGGMTKRVAMARALALDPPVLILDEPSAGLSPKIVADVFAMLKRINGDGVTIVLVEQNVKAAMAIADRAVILAEGRIRHEGTPSELADDPLIGQIYLGTARHTFGEVAR